MAYVYLAIEIVAEVVATASLKATEGFSRFWPSVIVVVGYGCAFYFLSLVLKSVPVGVAYALWSGIGILLVTVVAAALYKQVPDRAALIGMSLIVGGVVVINVFSATTAHGASQAVGD